ncbi:hypothetical protein COP1_018840 [Malus domestica]
MESPTTHLTTAASSGCGCQKEAYSASSLRPLPTSPVSPTSIFPTIPYWVIDLSFNHLVGPFPPSSNGSSHLQIINLSSNFFNGTIPSSVLVPSISIFNVSNNSFSGLSGPIGDGIMNLTNLNILELFSNLFAGPIPTHIGSLFKLETLLLHINKFTGPLPFQVGNAAPPTSYR